MREIWGDFDDFEIGISLNYEKSLHYGKIQLLKIRQKSKRWSQKRWKVQTKEIQKQTLLQVKNTQTSLVVKENKDYKVQEQVL